MTTSQTSIRDPFTRRYNIMGCKVRLGVSPNTCGGDLIGGGV